MTRETLAGVCEWPYDSRLLWKALKECGWIEVRDGIVTVHEWQIHNAALVTSWGRGAYGKLGGKAAKTPKVPASNLGQTREEKRREDENKNPPVIPPGGGSSPSFEQSVSANGNEASVLLRLKKIFGLGELDVGDARAWEKKETRAAVMATTHSDLSRLEWFYELDEGEYPDAKWRRKSLAQLLKNWNGEIVRSRVAWERLHPSAPAAKTEAEVPGWRDLISSANPEVPLPATWGELTDSGREWARELYREAKKKEE